MCSQLVVVMHLVHLRRRNVVKLYSCDAPLFVFLTEFEGRVNSLVCASFM